MIKANIENTPDGVQTLTANIKNIPDEVKKYKTWVNCFADKIPKDPKTGQNAKTNDPETWGTFEQAVKNVERGLFPHIGFVFDGESGFFGVDLDHCLDDVDFCDEFVETLQSYAEISRSGSGIHIICKGELPAGPKRRGNVEMYSSGRYFIVTGNLYNEKYKQITDCTEAIKILHSKYLPTAEPQVDYYAPKFSPVSLDDAEIIDKARSSKGGNLFSMLYQGEWNGIYSSQSEADLALCNQLAFWTGKNPQQMDRLFRASGLYRAKWDKKRGFDTYGNITIGKAIAGCTSVYEPTKSDGDTSLAMAMFRSSNKGRNVITAAQEKPYDLNDTGNAHRLYDKYGDIIRYSYNRKKWYFWDGRMWQMDDLGEIKKLADDVCEDLKRQAYLQQDDEIQEQMLKFAHRTASSKSKEAMIKECQHLNDIPASPDDFDGYRDYLNCQNGIVNLRTGELIPHDARFMMSKICLSEYDTTGKKPKAWLQFLDDVTNGDQELQEYIQRCVGYSITGSTREQCAYFLYGIGNNGKSTFLDTIADLLGGYSANAQPDTLMMSKFASGGANSDIARLKSARFVTSEEPTEGVRLNEGLLKQLTGGSKITCRFLYGDEFEYTPEFKIWIATNHKPIIRGTDFGIWRRIKLIPFEVNIPPSKVDKNMKYKLRQEFPQILHWAVEGCLKWQREGIKEPKCVIDATKEYKAEMDLIASFVEQCLVIDYDTGGKIMASDLFSIYSKWAKMNNEYEMSSKKFFSEAAKKLPDRGRNGKGIYYGNVRLSEYAQDLKGRSYSFSDFR